MAVELRPGCALSDSAPGRCHGGAFGISVPQKDQQITRTRGTCACADVGHQAGGPLRGASYTTSIPVRRSRGILRAAAERLRTTKTTPLRGCWPRTCRQTAARESMNPSEIDRLGGQKDTALGCALEHQWASRKARTRAARERVALPERRRRRAPSARSSSISVSGSEAGG